MGSEDSGNASTAGGGTLGTDTTGPGGSGGSGDTGDTGDTGGSALLPHRVQRIVDALNASFYQCSDRGWPGYQQRYRTVQVLFTSEADNIGYLWNDQSLPEAERPGVTIINGDELDAPWYSRFNMSSWNDIPTIGISLDWTEDLNQESPSWSGDHAISLTHHESFHYFIQDSWNLNRRFQDAWYPEPWTPRYYRASLGERMRTLVDDHPESLDLGAVAYWQQRLLAEFADDMDVLSGTDISEGTAQYVGARMDGIAALGCDVSEEELRAGLVEHIDEWVTLSTYSQSNEYYGLGVLAGWLMDDQGRSPEWNALVSTGVTPVDALIVGVSTVDQPDDPDLIAAVQAAAEERTATIAESIEPMLDRMADNQYARVALPWDWYAGSFTTRGFYQLLPGNELAGYEITTDATAYLQNPEMVDINIVELTVMENLPTPCTTVDPDAGFTVATVAIADVSESSPGLYTSTAPELTFTGLSGDVIDDNGTVWLCPPAPAAGPVKATPMRRIAVIQERPGQRPRVTAR